MHPASACERSKLSRGDISREMEGEMEVEIEPSHPQQDGHEME